MSISVRILYRGTEENFPLASSDVFKRDWLPGAVALNLSWVKQFDALQLRPSNLQPVIDELQQLREWFYKEYPFETAAALAGRIERLLPALEALKSEEDFSYWIG